MELLIPIWYHITECSDILSYINAINSYTSKAEKSKNLLFSSPNPLLTANQRFPIRGSLATQPKCSFLYYRPSHQHVKIFSRRFSVYSLARYIFFVGFTTFYFRPFISMTDNVNPEARIDEQERFAPDKATMNRIERGFRTIFVTCGFSRPS